MPERIEYSYKVPRVSGYLAPGGSEKWPYYEGRVETPLGYVLVYAQVSTRPGDSYTTFRAIVSGFEHTLTIPRAVTTSRGASIIAGRWIRQLHEEVGS